MRSEELRVSLLPLRVSSMVLSSTRLAREMKVKSLRRSAMDWSSASFICQTCMLFVEDLIYLIE